jgi:hypothetical protein
MAITVTITNRGDKTEVALDSYSTQLTVGDLIGILSGLDPNMALQARWTVDTEAMAKRETT